MCNDNEQCLKKSKADGSIITSNPGPLKLGDVIKHGHQTGVIYEITGETLSKYNPPVGSLNALICNDKGTPYKLESSDGKRYFSFTVYNWPDEIERVEIIGHIDPETLHPYIQERAEEAEADRMKKMIEPHFVGVIRKSGDLYIHRQRAGTKCYVYFASKECD